VTGAATKGARGAQQTQPSRPVGFVIGVSPLAQQAGYPAVSAWLQNSPIAAQRKRNKEVRRRSRYRRYAMRLLTPSDEVAE
jgi:hypothetical protein